MKIEECTRKRAREQNKLELSELILTGSVQRDTSMKKVGKLSLREIDIKFKRVNSTVLYLKNLYVMVLTEEIQGFSSTSTSLKI